MAVLEPNTDRLAAFIARIPVCTAYSELCMALTVAFTYIRLI